ncbi:MAG: hypothetical protein SFW67_16615 [Myxococcaceae bacterium]|nr:hypothetical protein [Myxococcaceae bacterium]
MKRRVEAWWRQVVRWGRRVRSLASTPLGEAPAPMPPLVPVPVRGSRK